jgi:hypothetical protein
MSSIIYLSPNPYSTTFPGSSLPAGMVQLPATASITAGAFATVSSNQLSLGFAAGTVNMQLSAGGCPKVAIPFASASTTVATPAGDSFNVCLQFKLNMTFTAGVSGKASCGVLAFDAENIVTGSTSAVMTTFHPIIEFAGTTTPSVIYSSDSSDTLGSTSGTANTLLSRPIWVRVLLIDNVMYAEQAAGSSSTPPTTGWSRFDNASAKGSVARRSSGTNYSSLVFFVRGQDNTTNNAGVTMMVSSLRMTVWPRWTVGSSVTALVAKTWPEGGRIDLSWQNATGVDAPQAMAIYRSKYGHQEFFPPIRLSTPAEGIGLTGFGELLYQGVPISSYSDTAVKDDTFYYYTVFATRAPIADNFTTDAGTLGYYANQPSSTDWGPQALPSNKVTGLSVRRRFLLDGEWLYAMFPLEYREQDQQDAADVGSSTGYLQRYTRFMQAGIDYMHGYVKGIGRIGDSEKAPLGLIGEAQDQTTIVDNLLRDFLFPTNAPGLDARGRRKLLQFGVHHTKLKGSTSGCCSFIRLITGWDNDICIEPGIGLNLRWLRTWDGFTSRTNITATGLTYSAGKISGFSQNAPLGVGGLVAGKYKGGLYVDWFGNVLSVADNDSDSITFNSSATMYKEMQYTGTVSATGVTLTALGTNARLPNQFAFNGGNVMSSGGNAIGSITATNYAALAGATEQIKAAGLTAGAGQTAAVAYSYTGATYAARVATHKLWLFVGEPSWIYHTGSDISLVGTSTDPFYHLWPGLNPIGSGKSYPMTDYDYLVWAPVGAAKLANSAMSSLSSSTIVLATIPATVVVGDYINPNRNQSQWFRIIDIQGSGPYTITVAPEGDTTPVNVANTSDLATIAERLTVEHDRNLRALMPLMLPFDSRLFIYYQ